MTSIDSFVKFIEIDFSDPFIDPSLTDYEKMEIKEMWQKHYISEYPMGYHDMWSIWHTIENGSIRPSVIKYLIDDVFDLDDENSRNQILTAFIILLSNTETEIFDHQSKLIRNLLQRMWSWLSIKIPEHLLKFGCSNTSSSLSLTCDSPFYISLFGYDHLTGSMYFQKLLRLHDIVFGPEVSISIESNYQGNLKKPNTRHNLYHEYGVMKIHEFLKNKYDYSLELVEKNILFFLIKKGEVSALASFLEKADVSVFTNYVINVVRHNSENKYVYCSFPLACDVIHYLRDEFDLTYINNVLDCLKFTARIAQQHDIDIFSQKSHIIHITTPHDWDLYIKTMALDKIYDFSDYLVSSHLIFDESNAKYLVEEFNIQTKEKSDITNDLNKLFNLEMDVYQEDDVESIFSKYGKIIKDPSYHESFLMELSNWMDKNNSIPIHYNYQWNIVPGFKKMMKIYGQ